MSTRRPYYRPPPRSPGRRHDEFASTGEYIDLTNAHLHPYETDDPVAKARALFDVRAAATVSTAVALDGASAMSNAQNRGPVGVWPGAAHRSTPSGVEYWPRELRPRALLELKQYKGKAPTVFHPTRKCLAAMAYLDFFPDRHREGTGLRSMVSGALLAAEPGWCGSLGPGQDNSWSLVLGENTEGNYDMSQMGLLPIAYQFYDALSPEARDRLIDKLLAHGRIHRTNLDDCFTSSGAPNDWDRAGYVSPLGAHKNLGETENHIVMIATARYLTNQLLFQRDARVAYDNRRNGGDDRASCLSILLTLLQNMLRDDFSEYNAKPYQTETRWALLNLCTYAYDHEVRLGARMVLDYISAHIAVSSNDLRRMVPFRRRNEGDYVSHDPDRRHMTVGLLEWDADPMTRHYAMQAGNTRAYELSVPAWSIVDDGTGLTIEVLSDYRLPPSVHDLFVTDAHRRFFQSLHRTVRENEMGGNHNCDNFEIYASSPSYLITAGGRPSGYAIDPRFAGNVIGPAKNRQQLGVAVTTSFMPTGSGPYTARGASDLIQFGEFVEGEDDTARNYGVAPDFACGHDPFLPPWVRFAVLPKDLDDPGFRFVDESGRVDGRPGPGFFLAIFMQNGLGLIEAFDTWLHPGVPLRQFAQGVIRRNQGLRLQKDEAFRYATANGNVLEAAIWWRNHVDFGAEVRSINDGGRDPADARCDAGDVPYRSMPDAKNRFLFGTVMNSPADAVVEITNPYLCTRLTLDMSDASRPRRIDENGEVEQAGDHNEVWLDFESTSRAAPEGDVCRPYRTIADAINGVADGGVVKIIPGATTARPTFAGTKSIRLVAPLGGVVIGARTGRPAGGDGPTLDADPVRKDDVWVQFDDRQFDELGLPAGPFNTIRNAVAAVKADGVIRVVPGATSERPTIGNGRSFRIVAPIGGVRIGLRI